MATEICEACYLTARRGAFSQNRIEIKIYEKSDLGDIYKMLDKVRKKLQELEDRHHHYREHKDQVIGKARLDTVEDELDLVINEYLRIQLRNR